MREGHSKAVGRRAAGWGVRTVGNHTRQREDIDHSTQVTPRQREPCMQVRVSREFARWLRLPRRSTKAVELLRTPLLPPQMGHASPSPTLRACMPANTFGLDNFSLSHIRR